MLSQIAVPQEVAVSARELCRIALCLGMEASYDTEGNYEIRSESPKSSFLFQWRDSSACGWAVTRDELVVNLDDFEVPIRVKKSGVDDLRTLVNPTGRVVGEITLSEYLNGGEPAEYDVTKEHVE